MRHKSNPCRTRIYRIWHNMVGRCHNIKDKQYQDYGAKGIHVCEQWKNSFEDFMNWSLSSGYADNLTVDRICNTRGYHPANCRWATPKQQANNRTNNILITWRGKTKTLMQWSEATGIHRSTLRQRILVSEWPIDTAMTRKPSHHKPE